MSNPDISYFGITNKRPPFRTFGIKQADRMFHMYAIGKTGTGKTTLLENIVLQDMLHGRGVGVIDPHGDMAERLVKHVPVWRREDLIYVNAADPLQPYGYNPLRKVAWDSIPLAVSGLMEAFKKIWGADAWGVRMEHILRNALYALIEYGDATLPDILRLFTDKDFRKKVTDSLRNEQVRLFWNEEFKGYNPRYTQEAISPIQNKVGAFLADPRLYRMLVKPEIDLRFRRVMDERKILIVNLAKGALGEDTGNLLGALFVTTIGLAALSRVNIEEANRRDFYLVIDEFQNFTTLSIANMVADLRKFRVGLLFAHQHLYQLEDDVRHAVLGNAGTIITFRLGPQDAELFAKEFEPIFVREDIVNLPNHLIYLKLMIDRTPSRSFSAVTLFPNYSTERSR
jgi:hypothetical protein